MQVFTEELMAELHARTDKKRDRSLDASINAPAKLFVLKHLSDLSLFS